MTVIAVIDTISMKLQITENNVLILHGLYTHLTCIWYYNTVPCKTSSIIYILLTSWHPKTYHFKSIPGLIYSLSIIQSNASVQRIVQ